MSVQGKSFKILIACLLSAGALSAADPDDFAIRRPSIGLRIQWTATKMFSISNVDGATTHPVAEYVYSGNSNFARFLLSPTIEYRLRPRISISGEFRFHHVKFGQLTSMKSGILDPNATSDDRITSTINQTNNANYWEAPVLLRYYGIRAPYVGRKAYALAGIQWRHIGRVRTGTDAGWADGVSEYDETPSVPNHGNQIGFVAGFGVRLVDKDSHIKLDPEVRYIRWPGSAFEGPSYRARLNQVEVGFGISF